MKNKRWTPQTEITDSLLKFREKRKWQISLRRYVVQKQKSPAYAPYFGISIEGFRAWIEKQFDKDLSWENFGKAWQMDHIVPVIYFDFTQETDLKTCWNFTNIRVEKLDIEKSLAARVDLMGAKRYFTQLSEATGYSLATLMVEKIESIEAAQAEASKLQLNFVSDRKEELEGYLTLSDYERDQLNSGMPYADILAERTLLNRFGN